MRQNSATLLHRPTGLLTYLLVHIAATEVNRAELAVNVFGSITNCTWTVQLYSPGCANVHLHVTYASLAPPQSTSQTTSRSVEPFLQGSRSWHTDRQTAHATPSVTTGRIYVRSTMRASASENNPPQSARISILTAFSTCSMVTNLQVIC